MSGAFGDWLATLPLFAEMSGLEVNAVSAFLEPKLYAKDDVVFREGEIGKELFIVRSGMIGSYATLPDGSRRDVYRFGPGLLFGEMAIIEDEPRTATCYAMEDSELLVMEGIDFYRLAWNYPMIGMKLLSEMARVMASWLDEASSFLGALVRWGADARHRAVTDELSGLFNRRFLEETMEARFRAGSSRRCALVMLDLDRFRDINAAFGPQAGDEVIGKVAKVFSSVLNEGELGARLSGDEFAVFLPAAGIERAMELAEMLRAAVEGTPMALTPSGGTEAKLVAVTISAGAAAGPERAASASDLVAAADAALFEAKRLGRNRVVSADAEDRGRGG
jgi:diguanylate cyclase (GGDEF)-like protein